jgi:hypothetical protein
LSRLIGTLSLCIFYNNFIPETKKMHTKKTAQRYITYHRTVSLHCYADPAQHPICAGTFNAFPAAAPIELFSEQIHRKKLILFLQASVRKLISQSPGDA